MAPTQRPPASLLLVAALVLSMTGLATAINSSGFKGGVTVYWGRNKDEGSLAEACDTGKYTIVIISFLDVFGHGDYHLDISGHDPSTLGADIKHCQSVALVYLSIGGFGNNYSLPTNQSALDLADHLWYTYMAGHKAGVHRHFGDDVEIDGIDFFIEHGSPDNYDVLANRLWSFNKGFRARTPAQLSATPRCSYPDRLLGKAIATGVIGRINIRFYDDSYCAVHWRQEWDKWAAVYPTQDYQLYFALPASEKVVGYVHLKSLHLGVLPVLQKAQSFVGFTIWDRYFDRLTNYSSSIVQWT